VKIDEYWICKKCRTMLKNPEWGLEKMKRWNNENRLR
jgi:hypothetical protein